MPIVQYGSNMKTMGGLNKSSSFNSLFMHMRFNHSPANCDNIMTHVCNLVYCVEQIGQINVAKLACLFLVHGLQTTHPLVHEALAPVLMDGMITLDALKWKLNYHYNLEASNNPDLLTFPSMSPILPQLPLTST